MRVIAKNRTAEQLADLVSWIRSTADARLEVILDLPGTKPRVGRLHRPLTLGEGESALLCPSSETDLGPGLPRIPIEALAEEHLSLTLPGHQVTIGDAAVVLEVRERTKLGLRVEVRRGGALEEGRSVGFPCINTRPVAMSEDDWRIVADSRLVDLLDGILVSFCEAAHTLSVIRSATRDGVALWAKIESDLAGEGLRAVVGESDAVVVGRNDLTENLRPSAAFATQNRILRACAELGRPCVVGTGVLESARTPELLSLADLTDFEHLVSSGATGFLVTGRAAKDCPLEAIRLVRQMTARFQARLRT